MADLNVITITYEADKPPIDKDIVAAAVGRFLQELYGGDMRIETVSISPDEAAQMLEIQKEHPDAIFVKDEDKKTEH